jgi:coniferyl-aldehyde dehydrogenase
MVNKAAVLAQVGDTEQVMRRVLDKQRAAHLAQSPLSAAQRQDRLTRAIALLVDHEADLVAALSADFGHRSAQQSRFTDIMSALQPLKHARKHLADWMRPERRSVQFPLNLLGARAWVEYQAKGVVGLISPWNFPVQLTFAPLAQIFAAGNAAMIKPSEYTKATSALMQSLFARYFDDSEVAVFTGDAEVGRAFASLPFDHLLFTGATSVGRQVMQAAAQNLVPVTLELGGKSPVIVSRSAPIAQAAERIVLGKMLNAGQICLAPDYLLVPQESQAAFSEALAQAAARLYPKLIDNPDYTSLINARHRQRLEGYLEDAQAQGAQVHVVNPADEDFTAQPEGLNKMPLTLVSQVHDQMRVMQDEIFGPILPILPYGEITQALDYINARPRPLGLYYFGTDSNEERLVLDKTTAGGVTLNDVIFHVAQEDLPFGGIGPAGMGAYHGKDGFKTFSHAKAIYRQPKLDIGKLAGTKPPYGAALQKTLAREIRK